MKKKSFLIFLAGAVVGAAGMYVVLSYSRETGWFSANRTRDAGAPPGRWAQPVEEAGLPNMYRVTKDLYRGAQPTAEGIKKLKEMGIKTVVNLRAFHSDSDEIGNTGMGYEHIDMEAWHPKQEELIRFLKIATDPEKTPVFVHCRHGSDRTGTMCAVYRVAVCGWSKDEAIDEMTKGGFGFHGAWDNLVEYIREIDIGEVKKQAGLVP